MEERISEPEDKNLEMIEVEEERDSRYFKNRKILWERSDSFRKSNIRVIGNPERKERKKGAAYL